MHSLSRGLSLMVLRRAGYSAQEIKAAKYSVKELKDSGFLPVDLIDAEGVALVRSQRSASLERNIQLGRFLQE
jgi:hypothetical protein